MKVGQRKRRLRVPLWVARSPHHKDDWKQEIDKLKEENAKAKRGADLNCTSIKYRIRTWIRKTDAPVPVGLQGVCGLFSARCHFSLWFSYVYDCIDKSLEEIEKLHAALEREYKEYWGDVGVSQHVRFLKQLMLKSFNFEAFFLMAVQMNKLARHFGIWLSNLHRFLARQVGLIRPHIPMLRECGLRPTN